MSALGRMRREQLKAKMEEARRPTNRRRRTSYLELARLWIWSMVFVVGVAVLIIWLETAFR